MTQTSTAGRRAYFCKTSFHFYLLDHVIVELENLEKGHVFQLSFRGFPSARVWDRHLGSNGGWKALYLYEASAGVFVHSFFPIEVSGARWI
jgi:hypothetical protein